MCEGQTNEHEPHSKQSIRLFSSAMRSALIAFLLLPSVLLAQEIDLTRPLPVDPGIDRMAALGNGLEYWIRANRTPPGKVSLILHIKSGSLKQFASNCIAWYPAKQAE